MNTRSLAIVISHLGTGGAERASANLANYFVTRGWSVTIVTLNPSTPDFYPLDPKIRRTTLNLGNPSGGSVKAALSNAKRILTLRSVLRDLNSDVVLGMTPECAVLSILATRGLSVRVVAAERNYPPKLRINRFWHLLRRLLYRFADLVVVQSGQAEKWIKRYASGSTSCIIPNAVSLPLPASSPAIEPTDLVAPNEKLILAVGRLTPQKGFSVLLPAVAELDDSLAPWRLVILGEGDQRNELVSKIAELGLSETVSLPGKAGNLESWYRRADVFVLSSFFEGFPNVLLEAMAHGVPCVSFNCPTGPEDIINNDDNGVLVSAVGDSHALAQAISRVLSSDSMRKRLGIRATDVTVQFSPDKIYEQWAKIL